MLIVVKFSKLNWVMSLVERTEQAEFSWIKDEVIVSGKLTTCISFAVLRQRVPKGQCHLHIQKLQQNIVTNGSQLLVIVA